MCRSSGVTPSFSSARSALAESDGGKPVSTRSAPSTSSTRALAVSARRKSRTLSWAISAICPAISTPVGPAPTTTNVSHARRRSASGSHSAASSAVRMRVRMSSAPSSDFSSGALRLPVVVAEVGVARSAGDDQAVVLQRARRGHACGRRRELHPPRVQVEAGRLGEHHLDVAPPAEDRAQRVTDLTRRQRAGGHLVGERLKQVEVAPIDQRDVDVGARQLQGGLQSREAAADEHGAVTCAGCHGQQATTRAASPTASCCGSAPLSRVARAA